ncbi:MAG: hypothetical protein IKT68_07030 [Clostridia bacterium]|nr:hypothetical protein [Clostridia bacterium]
MKRTFLFLYIVLCLCLTPVLTGCSNNETVKPAEDNTAKLPSSPSAATVPYDQPTVTTDSNDVSIKLYESQNLYQSPIASKSKIVADNEAYRHYVAQNANLLPGMTIAKYTYLENVGTTPAYVRFVVTLPATFDQLLTLTYNTSPEYVVTTNLTATTATYFITYTDPLQPGEITPFGLAGFAMRGDVTETEINQLDPDSLSVTVTGNAVKADHNFANATVAFAMFDGAHVMAVDSKTNLLQEAKFPIAAAWEPGHVVAVDQQLTNVGPRAVKYTLSVANIGNDDIAKMLDVYSGVYSESNTANGTESINGTYLGTLAELMEQGRFTVYGANGTNVLLPGETVPFHLIVKMKEEAGNEHQGKTYSFTIAVSDTEISDTTDNHGNTETNK